MTEVNNSIASFASRLVVVFSYTLLFIFTALLILDNKELQKLAPHSLLRSTVLLCGYIAGLLSLNYVMALRGGNMTEWTIELLIKLNFIIFFAAMTLPWLFPTSIEISGTWRNLWSSSKSMKPNYNFLWLLAPQIPLLLYTAYRVRLHFRSPSDA